MCSHDTNHRVRMSRAEWSFMKPLAVRVPILCLFYDCRPEECGILPFANPGDFNPGFLAKVDGCRVQIHFSYRRPKVELVARGVALEATICISSQIN